MFVVYDNGEECIITTVKNERKTLKMYFFEGGRDVEEYNRKEVSDIAVHVYSRLSWKS